MVLNLVDDSDHINQRSHKLVHDRLGHYSHIDTLAWLCTVVLFARKHKGLLYMAMQYMAGAARFSKTCPSLACTGTQPLIVLRAVVCKSRHGCTHSSTRRHVQGCRLVGITKG
jgi:hypothetical protein